MMKRAALFIIVAALTVLVLTPHASRADHSIFPIYNLTHLKTTEGDSYSFYSPGFNYTYNAKKNFRFFSSISVLFPLRSKQNGEQYKNSDYYDGKLGTDIVMGTGGKVPLGDRFMIVPSGGVHLNGIRLRGTEEYMDFSNLSLGLGTNVQTRFALGSRIDLTGLIALSWDFADLIHQEGNKLRNGFGLTLGAGLTF